MPQQLVDILDSTEGSKPCCETGADFDDDSYIAQQDVEEDTEIENMLDVIFEDEAEEE